MLNEAERRRCEKLVKESGWFARVGVDWFYLALGAGLIATAVAQEPARNALFPAAAGGFAVGGAFARLFLAKDQQLLARLYREWVRREGAPPAA